MLTVEGALIIGGSMIVVSSLTAAFFARTWYRHEIATHDFKSRKQSPLTQAEEDGQVEQQQFTFQSLVPSAAVELDSWHTPPRLSIGNQKERVSESSRAPSGLVGLRLA